MLVAWKDVVAVVETVSELAIAFDLSVPADAVVSKIEDGAPLPPLIGSQTLLSSS